MVHIPIVLGTARKARRTERVARAVADIVAAHDGVSSELVDVADHVREAATVPPWAEGGANDNPTKWREIVERSDALVLVIPEYNHGYPGELKLLLDSLWKHYKGMPVGMVGVSTGMLGGARLLDHIKPVLVEMHLHPIRESVNWMKVKESFTEDGAIAKDKTKEAVEGMLESLVATAHALAPLRSGD